MMTKTSDRQLLDITDIHSLWNQVFMNFPLVIVGSREADGSFDLAPKHLAMPLSWENHFGFVCTPAHATYQNIKTHGEFTVSYPRPEQIVLTSLTASPRCNEDHKSIIDVLPTFKAEQVEGVFIEDAYLYLECRLDRIIDNFGNNSLITGTIILAHVDKGAYRLSERDDDEIMHTNPILAYLPPGRFASIDNTLSFPFPDGFKR